MPHATRGRDGRQEGRERSYYYLHCNLNNTLFHFPFQIFFDSDILCFFRRPASRWGLALPQTPLDGVWY